MSDSTTYSTVAAWIAGGFASAGFLGFFVAMFFGKPQTNAQNARILVPLGACAWISLLWFLTGRFAGVYDRFGDALSLVWIPQAIQVITLPVLTYSITSSIFRSFEMRVETTVLSLLAASMMAVQVHFSTQVVFALFVSFTAFLVVALGSALFSLNHDFASLTKGRYASKAAEPMSVQGQALRFVLVGIHVFALIFWALDVPAGGVFEIYLPVIIGNAIISCVCIAVWVAQYFWIPVIDDLLLGGTSDSADIASNLNGNGHKSSSKSTSAGQQRSPSRYNTDSA